MVIAAVMNADESVSCVYTNTVPLSGRETDVSCEVQVSDGQFVRAWAVESLENINPISGVITDIKE